MQTYRIPVVWQMWGIYEVEAYSMVEAECQALDELPLPEGHYLGDSMEIDRESVLYGEITKEEVPTTS